MKLSIVIPSRNEEFLGETIEDILKNKRADTEIIVGLDGQWPMKPIKQYPDVNYIYFSETIGQRAITNRCVDLANGEYIMKVDAHCAFDEGFDQKMIDGFKGNEEACMVPMMKNLHIFDWVCKCGFSHYQDKGDVCPECDGKMEKKMMWRPRRGSSNWSYCFDTEPHFQYFSAYKEKTPGDIVETMSLQGSCFMCTKRKYKELNVCDETFGSWGSQGIEVACKFWLSGSRVLANKKTWYAHCFRTKSIFGFPYSLSGRQVNNSRKMAKDLFFNGKWPLAKRPLSWLVKKFWPVPGWTEEDLKALK